MNNIIESLAKCEKLLRSVNSLFWADKIKNVILGIKRNAPFVDEILSWYGGMGSFSDLVISQCNGHKLTNKDEERINNELNKFKEEIYREVILIKRSYNF